MNISHPTKENELIIHMKKFTSVNTNRKLRAVLEVLAPKQDAIQQNSIS
jgi:hypothetical protein